MTRILDCGGKQRATPLSRVRRVIKHPKTSRPLESGVAAVLGTPLEGAPQSKTLSWMVKIKIKNETTSRRHRF
jgi:hypothetical protein